MNHVRTHSSYNTTSIYAGVVATGKGIFQINVIHGFKELELLHYQHIFEEKLWI